MNEHPNVDGPSAEDEEFARQLAAVLRASDERPGSDFDGRVMAAVRAVSASTPEVAVTSIEGWRRRRALALPPVAWGALAAGFAMVVSLGTLATVHMMQRRPAATVAVVTPRVAPAPVAPPAAAPAPVATPVTHVRRDTVYMVRFVLADADAHTVSLVGDFNEWEKRATPLRADRPGVWTAQVALPPGRHEYAYVVDGKRWVADPAAEQMADDFDTPSSVVTVGREGMGGK